MPRWIDRYRQIYGSYIDIQAVIYVLNSIQVYIHTGSYTDIQAVINVQYTGVYTGRYTGR